MFEAFLEKYKFSFLVAVIGFIYFTTFYFIDKVVTNNYLIKALTISFLIIFKSTFNPEFLNIRKNFGFVN